LRGERILFVTGRLAESSLRDTVAPLAAELDFAADVFVAKISVAALLTVDWLVGKLSAPAGTTRVVLPGWCHGDTGRLTQFLGGIPVERGPKDLRELPAYLGKDDEPPNYGRHDIEILAEINHADEQPVEAILEQATRHRAAGADVIDLGCTPGRIWATVGDVVRELVRRDFRVSIDSFNGQEVAAATAAGAELVLSVNGSNASHACDWGAEVVVIPDNHQQPDWCDQLARTVERLEKTGVRYRLDPILDPIGFGFATALGRYLETRRRFPHAEIMMGIGNLTELTEVDSAGVNAVLIGFCQEIGVRSVLTTEVINWARSSVQELAAARKLMYYAVSEKKIPKHIDAALVMLRDLKVTARGGDELVRLQQRIRDPNFRIFAERGQIHVMNNARLVSGDDPFVLFAELGVTDPSHAFYLGWEMMKAHAALQLGKEYVQDQALRWGLLTTEETSFHDRQRQKDEA
jgi:dihydropteroate synthase-like protein